MPKKTIKKTSVKKPVAKKTVKMTKPAAKKTASKKTSAKRASRPVVIEMPAVAAVPQCHCGGGCCCKCGHSFINFCIKVVLLCLVFFAGALTAPYFMRAGHHAMMRHLQFDDNGCLNYDSVKCPKMLEALKEAYPDMNTCVTRDAVRAVVSRNHKHGLPKHEPMQVEGTVVEPTID